MKKATFVLEGRIRKCVAWKNVFSRKLGRTVKRCAKYKRV